MKRDDIIRMARKAGFLTHENSLYTNHRYGDCLQEVEHFAALVRAAERKACCQIVTGLCISDNNAEEINKAILAREQA